MKSVTSKDGTLITFDQLGQGAPMVLVSGGSGHKGPKLLFSRSLHRDFGYLAPITQLDYAF